MPVKTGIQTQNPPPYRFPTVWRTLSVTWTRLRGNDESGSFACLSESLQRETNNLSPNRPAQKKPAVHELMHCRL
jgi:hypothetical protein